MNALEILAVVVMLTIAATIIFVLIQLWRSPYV